MKQLSLHISFTKDDYDIYSEINRLSALNHRSVANQTRDLIRKGLAKSTKTETPALV